MKKYTIIGSVLAAITTSLGIVFCINPQLFLPLDRGIFKRMYEANETKLKASRGETGSEKEKDKREEEFLIKWANESLCPTYKNRVKDKREQFGKDYVGFFNEIEGHCKDKPLAYNDQNSIRIGLKSIFVGLKDIK